MKLLRNKEVRQGMVFFCMLSCIFTIAAFLLQPEFAFLMAVCSVTFTGSWLFITFRRYQRLQDMSLEIDRILYDESRFDLSRFAEGELSILSSEVYKMTMRLREQAALLQKDKIYLNNAIADISHQIRTPLTSINLIADFLAEEGISEKRRKELTRELFQLLARIDWLITTLLKMSKLDTGTVQMEKAVINAEELVKKAAEPIAISMDLRSQELIIKAKEGAFLVGDMAWTAEAVENILKNCMEHTPEGGRLMVEIQENTMFTEISISDTGAGIATEDLPHLFERFYKGKNAGKNSVGIGLAMAQMIVTAQNGVLKAENGADGGARFILRFYKTTV